MKKSMFPLSLCIIVLLLTVAYAQNTYIPLLSVSEVNNTDHGNIAGLTLDIQDGVGQVFIDTQPISKYDTQLSVRFAKDIACKLAEVDCSQYNFLYTIRANTQVIGGPSAGAAIAALTYAQLKNLDIRPDVTITGTITSGRLIGSVGGVKEKIEAAAKNNLKIVLISPSDIYHKPINKTDPFEDILVNVSKNNSNNTLNTSIKVSIIKENETISQNISISNTSNYNETNLTNQTNTTINLVEYGKTLNIRVIPAADLEEVIFYTTGKNISKPEVDLDVDTQYSEIMKEISSDLCQRSQDYLEVIYENTSSINQSYLFTPLNKTYSDAKDLLNRSKHMLENKSYYAGASQCYNANLKLSFISLIQQNHSDEFYQSQLTILQESIALLEGNIKSKNFTTIPELQTAMIVRQRLSEAQEYIDAANDYNFSKNTTTNESTNNESLKNESANNQSLKNQSLKNTLSDTSRELEQLERDAMIMNTAMAKERMFTTGQWATFFDVQGDIYNIDKKVLSESCESIMADAMTRIQYVNGYFPGQFNEQENIRGGNQ